MERRRFLTLMGGVTLASVNTSLPGLPLWPDEGIWNPCLTGPLPTSLANNELVRAAWQDVDPSYVWDSHVHLIGTGDSESGIWINPNLRSLFHPIQFIQMKFYLNASCVRKENGVDNDYVSRLLALHEDLPSGVRLMLLGFDYHYNEAGERVTARSPYHTPNAYAAGIAKKFPNQCEWIASIHPYRKDALEALAEAVASGARAVKWLPPAMGMDPASPLCDRFYRALARYRIPLLSHGGTEHAVDGRDAQALGNPLLLRRALDHGVRVIVAHCAVQGKNRDLDEGPNGPRVQNFELFTRLMDQPQYDGSLFGEISAVTQINHVGPALRTIILRDDWHHRLINGSDYPLPGVMPLISMRQLLKHGYLSAEQAQVCSQIRQYNPLLADFLIKRNLTVEGKRLSPRVFESRRVFAVTDALNEARVQDAVENAS